MDYTSNSCYTRKKRVPFEKLTLADDFLFCKVMQNKRLCKELLEIILHVKIDNSLPHARDFSRELGSFLFAKSCK